MTYHIKIKILNLFKHLTYLISIFLLAYSCKKQEIAQEEHQLYIPETDFNYYFPLQTDSLDKKPFVYQEGKLDPDINILYSSMLKNMKEPNLRTKNDSGYIIRYSAIPAFGLPYSIRIQKIFNDWFVSYKMLAFDNLDSYPHYGNDTIVKDTILPISWHEFYQLENKIKEFDISRRSTHNEWGFDGVIHVLELYKNGKLEFLHRWSPREEDEKEFIEICKLIEDLYSKK